MSVPGLQVEDLTLDLRPEHQALAWHEAGHAVAMLLLGQRFEYVTIVPTTRALGHIVFSVDPPDGATARERRRWLADAIVHAYAGGAA